MALYIINECVTNNTRTKRKEEKLTTGLFIPKYMLKVKAWTTKK
jgi:hypothetical protein